MAVLPLSEQLDKIFSSYIKSATGAGGVIHESVQDAIRFYSQQMLDILNKNIVSANAQIKSGSNPIPNAEVVNTSVAGLAFTINITIPSVQRASWYPEKYSQGVYNLVGLLNQGYEAKDYVYKTMVTGSGVKIKMRSLKKRQGMHFVQNSVRQFNAMAPMGVRASSNWDGIGNSL